MAVIADVHSNAIALEAVLADVRGRGIERIVNLGDNLNGPVDPARAAALLRGLERAVQVRGNGDRFVGDAAINRGTVAFARERIGAEALGWLASLPAVHDGGGWFACHGTPASDTDYLLEEVTAAGVRPRDPAGVAERLGGVSHPLILCGHTHLPRVVRLGDGRLVVNPGSVGLQAYTDEVPWPHRMETGSPPARYAVVSKSADGGRAELCTVAYDWERAAELAQANGFAGWVPWIRTGRATSGS